MRKSSHGQLDSTSIACLSERDLEADIVIQPLSIYHPAPGWKRPRTRPSAHVRPARLQCERGGLSQQVLQLCQDVVALGYVNFSTIISPGALPPNPIHFGASFSIGLLPQFQKGKN